MKRKTYEKIKYVVISCIVALSLVVSVNAPCLFQAKTSTLLHTYNLGSGNGWGLNFTDNNLIPSSVYYMEDSSAGGNVKATYQFGEWYYLFYTPVVLDYSYFMLEFDLLTSSLSITGTNLMQVSFAVGTLDEFQRGEYHTLYYKDLTGLSTANGVFSSDMSYISEYGVGTSIYCGLIFKGYIYHTGTTSSVYPAASGSFDIDMDVYGIDIDGAYNAIYELLGDIYYDNLDILAELQSIDASTQQINAKLQSLLTYVQNNYNQLVLANSNIVDIENLLRDVSTKLNSMQDSLDDVNTELDNHSSWLEKIWNSIQEFLSPDEESQDKQNDFNSSVNSQVGELGNLSGSLEFSKPDINDINVNVNTYLPQEYIDNYSELLKVFTNHTVVKNMLLVAFTICIISYTLFGKRK